MNTADATAPLAPAAGSAFSCFDCTWHREAGYWAHVVCVYPRERVAAVVALSGFHDGVGLTKDIAATICPDYTSPNDQVQELSGGK